MALEIMTPVRGAVNSKNLLGIAYMRGENGLKNLIKMQFQKKIY